MTDVTGFGLLGHLLEMCRGAGLGARIQMSSVPLLQDVTDLAAEGIVTGASARNWASYGDQVRLAPQVRGVAQALLCDPQTSGGLLVACAPEAAAAVMDIFARHRCPEAAPIGSMIAAGSGVTVDP
jgi:selenide,water dikinase